MLFLEDRFWLYCPNIFCWSTILFFILIFYTNACLSSLWCYDNLKLSGYHFTPLVLFLQIFINDWNFSFLKISPTILLYLISLFLVTLFMNWPFLYVHWCWACWVICFWRLEKFWWWKITEYVNVSPAYEFGLLGGNQEMSYNMVSRAVFFPCWYITCNAFFRWHHHMETIFITRRTRLMVISHSQLTRLGTTWHASGWIAIAKELVRLV